MPATSSLHHLLPRDDSDDAGTGTGVGVSTGVIALTWLA